MAGPTRKFNPGFLTDDELVASYCVRTAELELLVEVLRDCTGTSNPHQLVIGPRGSGKTTLLLRVAAEVPRDAALASRFFPVVFAEESYDVATAGEFWLECLTNLAAQAPPRDDAPDLHRTVDEFRAIRDDRTLADRCLGALLDFADREGKRLLLLVENLNMLFRDVADADEGWRLRKTLQTEPRIIMFASATSRFEQIDHPDRALYDLFRIRTLRPLDTEQCAVLWKTVTDRVPARRTVRSLEILTGGSPRLISIVASFGAGSSFRELIADLFDLVDDHTEYFKGHIESLPAQERRVYLALAALWKPATTREIADQARVGTSTCSAQLARLGERGVVQVAGGTARRKQYYLTERLYNIYYLLRRRRGPDRLVEALVHFMESYYSPLELRAIRDRMVRDAGSLGPEMGSLQRIALAYLAESPSLAKYPDELLPMMPAEPRGSAQPHERAARALFKTASKPGQRAEDTLAAYDELIRRFGESEGPAVQVWVAKALVHKGAALGKLDRPQDALECCDEVVRRFGESDSPALLESVAIALVNKAIPLGALNGPQDVLGICDEVVRRFGESDSPALQESVATALLNKGRAFDELNRPQDALKVYDGLVRRFEEPEAPGIMERVAAALLSTGVALGDLNRPQDALKAYDELDRRFGESDSRVILESVASGLVNRGSALVALNRPQDVLDVCDEVIRRFGGGDTPALLESVATALGNKGAALGALNRPQDALEVCDEVVGRFGQSEVPALQESVARALVNRARALVALNRPQDALEACDEVVRRFGASDAPALLVAVAAALVNKGAALGTQNRSREALRIYDDVIERVGKSEVPAVLEWIAKALMYKAAALDALNRPQDALEAYDEVVRRFERSDVPALVQAVATALVNRGVALAALNRPQDVLETCSEVVHRFGKSETPTLLASVATALVNRGGALSAMDRPQEALEACDEVVHRFGESPIPAVLERVATALTNKGAALDAQDRPREALKSYDEVVHRFGEGATPALGLKVQDALLGRAKIEIEGRQFEAAAETAGRVIERPHRGSSEQQLGGHLIRATALLALGDRSKCEHDIRTVLELPGPVLRHGIMALIDLSVALGPQRMHDLIQASPAVDLLLPLKTALERELGHEPRVAREVDEVARDIQNRLADLRGKRGRRPKERDG